MLIQTKLFRSILVLASSVAVAQSLPDVDKGQALFETHCTLCHGINGKGSRGPSLTRAKLAKAPDDAILKKLIEGGLEPEMPGSWFLSGQDLTHLASYVRSLGPVAEKTPMSWEVKLSSPPWAGVLSTAGGLVFSGTTEGNAWNPSGRAAAGEVMESRR